MNRRMQQEVTRRFDQQAPEQFAAWLEQQTGVFLRISWLL